MNQLPVNTAKRNRKYGSAFILGSVSVFLREKSGLDKCFAQLIYFGLFFRGKAKMNCYLIGLFLTGNLVLGQERNFHTTIGLSLGSAKPMGTFRSSSISDLKSGFAYKGTAAVKIILEQNVFKNIGISLNFCGFYYAFDYVNFGKSLAYNNRGLAPDKGLIYNLQITESEWKTNVANLGVYYYRKIGKRDNLLMKITGAFTITQMYSPAMVIEITDSTKRAIEVRTIESANSYREPFFYFPVDGFSLELSAHYFFYKGFALRPSLYFVNSICYWDGNEKALINLSRIRFQSLSAMLGLSYTINYRRISEAFDKMVDQNSL